MSITTSKTLLNLDHLFVYLSALHHEGLILLIRNFPELFGDMPGCTHLIKHDDDVGVGGS